MPIVLLLISTPTITTCVRRYQYFRCCVRRLTRRMHAIKCGVNTSLTGTQLHIVCAPEVSVGIRFVPDKTCTSLMWCSTRVFQLHHLQICWLDETVDLHRMIYNRRKSSASCALTRGSFRHRFVKNGPSVI